MNMHPLTEKEVRPRLHKHKIATDLHHRWGLKRFIRVFEGISNKMYGTKLPGPSEDSQDRQKARTYKTTRALLYLLPVKSRSVLSP